MKFIYSNFSLGNKQIVNSLIMNGANVSIVDDSGHTPLHLAAVSGN